MNRKSHILIGVVSTEFICNMIGMPITGLKEHIGVVAISSIASTFPDLDLLIPFMRHRTWTHSILSWFITMSIAYSFGIEIGMIWSISYLSHLLADSLTVMGVPFLYPFIKKKYGLKIL